MGRKTSFRGVEGCLSLVGLVEQRRVVQLDFGTIVGPVEWIGFVRQVVVLVAHLGLGLDSKQTAQLVPQKVLAP